MESELKPCPFCGNTKIRDNEYIRDGRQVVCSGCGASTQAYNPLANKKAKHLWNSRTQNKDLIEALEKCKDHRKYAGSSMSYEEAYNELQNWIEAALTKARK
jgi:Lar family restriction alleviation protein